MPVLNKQDIRELYRKRARRYNLSANLYYLMGFREQAYRKKAVAELRLRPGDTVVEIGCGTGLNFPLLHHAVDPEGWIIGVDLTDRMLEQARQRIDSAGWKNVELVQSDAAQFQFPRDVGGIISTFALTLVPEFDAVIKHGCEALLPGRRWVVLDLKRPSNRFLAWTTPLFIFLTRLFGVQQELSDRHPWESIVSHVGNLFMRELYLGFAYIATGERGGKCH